MKHKLWAVISLTAFVFGLAFGSFPTTSQHSSATAHMPPHPDKILAALIARGEIPANASPEMQEKALEEYLQKKLQGNMDKSANPQARQKVAANEKMLTLYTGEVRGRKLGQDGYAVDPSAPQFQPLEGTDKLLVILADFSDVPYTWTTELGEERTEAGPLNSTIPQPENDFDLWVEDFTPQHFEEMLFTPGGWSLPVDHPYYPGETRGSMRDYFIEQSYGKYTVDGDVFGWFTVDKPEAYYGDDDPDSGSDSLRPGTPQDLLSDVVAKVNETAALPWAEYDLDGDCVIDHPLFVHAGIDQSGGGGEQGDDAIWAHSASTDIVVATTADPACPEIFLKNYTIMPEDGGVGVFAHEFAHDLGLPDEYDTIYSGYGDSNAFWTLQSSGSWVGRPAQTQPAGMSIWAKSVLGWVDPEENLSVIDVGDLGNEPNIFRLEQTERWGGEGTINAILVNLPDKYYYVNDPYSGDWEWFGGKADEIDTTLRRTVDLSAASSAELSFWTWYDIEELWDYGFVQVSEDGGATWVSLPIDGTTMDIVADAYPSIVPNLPGFTGNSGGWVNKTFDLQDYVGQSIELQFRYMTDWGTTFAGFYLDDIAVTADGTNVFSDTVETLDPAWIVDGWTREEGEGYKSHYYIMEWRNLNAFTTGYSVDASTTISITNTDAGLNAVYSFDPFDEDGVAPTALQPVYWPYQPGLLLFYRDMTYTDNWTGAHPGGGFMLLVDAHKRPLIRPPYKENYAGLVWDTRVQSFDAAFGLDRIPDLTLTRYDNTHTYQGISAVPNFKDNFCYWSPRTPAASVITPEYGLLFRILGQATDKSAILIGLGNKNTLDEEYLSFTSDFFMLYETQTYLPVLAR